MTDESVHIVKEADVGVQQQSKSNGTKRRIRVLTKPPVPCFRKQVCKKKVDKANLPAASTSLETIHKTRISKSTSCIVSKLNINVKKGCEGSTIIRTRKHRVRRKPSIPHFTKCKLWKVKPFQRVKKDKDFPYNVSLNQTRSGYRGTRIKRKPALPDFSSMRKRRRKDLKKHGKSESSSKAFSINVEHPSVRDNDNQNSNVSNITLLEDKQKVHPEIRSIALSEAQVSVNCNGVQVSPSVQVSNIKKSIAAERRLDVRPSNEKSKSTLDEGNTVNSSSSMTNNSEDKKNECNQSRLR